MMTIRDKNGNIQWRHETIDGFSIVVHAKDLAEASKKIDAIVVNRQREKERLEKEAAISAIQKVKSDKYLPIIDALKTFLKENIFHPDPDEIIVIDTNGIRVSQDNGRCYYCDDVSDWEVLS